jgi:ankyrin repeat protein
MARTIIVCLPNKRKRSSETRDRFPKRYPASTPILDVSKVMSDGASSCGAVTRSRSAGQARSSSLSQAVSAGLIANAASLDARDPLGRTALWRASNSGDEASVRLLLSAGASPHLGACLGCTTSWPPLFRACEGAFPGICALLLDAGAPVNVGLEVGGHRGWTPLHSACASEDEVSEAMRDATVELLLNRGAEVNAKFGFAWTPFSEATNKALHSTLAVLLRYGAIPNDYGG